jgi:hypothetical protein
MLRKWFVRWHGEGAPHQADLYRCETCHGLVTHKRIRTGQLCCQGAHFRPTNPRLFEVVRLFAFPWTV